MVKQIGKDAVISVNYKYVHPSEHVRRLYPNPVSGERLTNCVVLRQEVKQIRKKQQLAIVFTCRHAFDDQELYAVKRWIRVDTEGHPDFFFDASDAAVEGEEEGASGDHPLIGAVDRVLAGGELDDFEHADIAAIATVDDDNEPAPENVGDDEAADVGQWGHDGVCPRRSAGATNNKPQLKTGLPSDGAHPGLVKLFELLFPIHFLQHHIIATMNKDLGHPVEHWEFLVFLGLWLLMATIQGPQRRDFWSKKPVSPFEGAPFRLNQHMSRNRFEDTLCALKFTSRQPPAFVDRFWEVRDMIAEWNFNMQQIFVPGWINCLDESMSVWTNMFTCPGFVCCPRKPWPFGNEHHSICCGLSGIMFGVELVEGKDRPTALPQPEHEQHGKTVGLLVRLTKALWHTGKLVVLDSGFCVVKGIIALRNKGVFAAALIKKRRYWPKFIDGNAIKAHFDDKPVGAVDSLKLSHNNEEHHVFAMKEPDYVMMLMSTHGTNDRDNGKQSSRKWNANGVTHETTFKYPEVVDNHYKYRHLVDDHNAKRHQPISLEKIWATARWACRVFAFLLAITEVNIFLVDNFFYNAGHTCMLGFRKVLAYALINNPYIPQQEESPSRRTSARRPLVVAHQLNAVPVFKKFRRDGTLEDCKQRYQQRRCSCGSRVRTYCACSPGIYRCTQCYADHLSTEEN